LRVGDGQSERGCGGAAECGGGADEHASASDAAPNTSTADARGQYASTNTADADSSASQLNCASE
jgi:hypothetical protein